MPKGLTKTELCGHMARHFTRSDRRLTRADAREFLDELQRLCEQRLLTHGQFSVPGVAKLVVETRRPRKGRNPITGKIISIPARRVVRGRISRRIRESVEGPI